MDADGQRRPCKYKAFITYSHADLEVARALQAGLHAFAKPWHQLRAVRVFRDQTNLAAGYEDGSVVRWDVRLSTWQRAAQALANRALSSVERERFVGTSQ
jgi:hypothetical protein